MLDFRKFLFKNFNEIKEFERMTRARLYKGKQVEIVGNFGISSNEWKIRKKDGKTLIVNEKELKTIYKDSDFLEKFTYRV